MSLDLPRRCHRATRLFDVGLSDFSYSSGLSDIRIFKLLLFCVVVVVFVLLLLFCCCFVVVVFVVVFLFVSYSFLLTLNEPNEPKEPNEPNEPNIHIRKNKKKQTSESP